MFSIRAMFSITYYFGQAQVLILENSMDQNRWIKIFRCIEVNFLFVHRKDNAHWKYFKCPCKYVHHTILSYFQFIDVKY